MIWFLTLLRYFKWASVPPKPMPSTDNNPLIEIAVTKMTNLEKIYAVAKESLGTHLTMDNTVDKSVGCAEAVSKVLEESGVTMPYKGIPGTAQLLSFLEKNSAFVEVDTQLPGTIIVSATGTGNGKIRGHTGVLGLNGILSNESQTGLWKEQWDMEAWDNYYTRYGGIPKRMFAIIG